MQPLEAAIMRTVLYGDVFDYPMTLEEIHHFLIHDAPVSLEQIRQTLPNLHRELTVENGYVACTGRVDLIAVRLQRAAMARELWSPALHWGLRLSRLPFVRLVGLTGALAMHNPSSPDDDLDYLLITAPGRVWLARAFAILLVYIGRLRGVTVCPNYVLAENVLEQTKCDLYIAHEITQIVPVYGFALYDRLREVNAWTSAFLPNSGGAFYRETERAPGVFWNVLKRGLEWALGGALGDRLEAWERRRKLRRFEADLKTPANAAQLDDSHVKGHFNDHGRRVLNEYQERLRHYGLLPDIVPVKTAAD